MAEENKIDDEAEANDQTPFHPVVELIIKRLESHPAEHSSWRAEVDRINMYTTKIEKAALRAAMREAFLGEAHKNVMKRLLVKPEEMTADRSPSTPAGWHSITAYGQKEYMRAQLEHEHRQLLEAAKAAQSHQWKPAKW